jgi:AraC family transcriptional regulator
MKNKEIILNAVQYIENNLKDELNVLKVSNEVCYSLYHFTRLFQSITGFSPKKYIQLRRLTEIVHELKNTNSKLSDIAYDYQFGSPETFSRAFKKQFNINPAEIRKGYSINNLSLIYPISKEYISHADNVRYKEPELLEMEERIFIGLSFFFDEDAELTDLSKEWKQVIDEAYTIQNKIQPEKYCQIQYWSDNQDLGGMFFFMGVEVSTTENENPLFVMKILPKGRYLKFIHKGLSNKVGHTYSYIYNQFLPDTEYRLTKSFNYEYYGKNYKGPYNEESESEIYIPVG